MEIASHFGMVALLCCMFLKHPFLRTPLDGCFWIIFGASKKNKSCFLFNFLVSFEEKPGECPVAPIAEECPPEAETTNGCLLDRECNGNAKCCSDGCSLVCTEPLEPASPVTIKGEPGDPGDPGEKVNLQFTEAATGGALRKKVLLKISQNSQENTCARVSFLFKRGYATGVFRGILLNF